MLSDVSKAVLPPGPRSPRFVQTLQWLRGSHRLMDRCHRRYGDIFTLRMLPVAIAGPGAPANAGEWVLLADPEAVRTVFSADPEAVLTGPTNRFLEGVVGPGSILLRDEPEHMAQRRVLLPPFHGERVAAYRELIVEVTQRELERWPTGRELPLWPRMQAITLEVIVRAVFGIDDPARRARMQALLRDMLNRLTGAPWVLGQTALALALGERRRRDPEAKVLGPVDAAIYAEIERRRSERDLADRADILSLLMSATHEDGSPLSDRELRDELITLLIAGHESTATELAWAFERLLRHPEMLERLRSEADSGGDAYADAVVKETLRLRPVLPVVLRELVEPIELGGRLLPAGTWVAPCAYLIHRRPDVYPEPLRFEPERFLDARPGTYTWMPFGGGVRRCVGAAFAQLEIKEVLRTVVGRLDLAPAGERPERMRPRFITLTPSRGARVTVMPRSTPDARVPAGSMR
jgi:cytochrome P450